MVNEHPLAFARCPAALLFEEEGDNMISDWTDYIVATRTKAGVYSIYVRKLLRKRWSNLEHFRDIKTANEIIATIEECEARLYVSVCWPEVIDAFKKLDVKFAKEIESIVKPNFV
ncbi:hypothetical protein SAMN05216299_109114 [Nitrosospira sp. Nsp14]|uniref:hypothetical protein n=1 Tax=Nitrosospira sp. Nsp14 TaxID=1855333 RepID=UPI0008E4F1C9|nr:hypothetical protein [Nitrosospira sp. Nsp14]SFH38246.1 hypothetical protein SAMN05216299_109114 [Nitrosospira sp. Nsp14]